MSRSPSMGILTACLAALLFHAVFFLMVRPLPGKVLADAAPAAPNTFYLCSENGGGAMSGVQVRTIASPVLFSLPSDLGFSRALHTQKIETLRFIPKPAKPERFLEVGPVPQRTALNSQELMLTSILSGAPDVPGDVLSSAQNRPSARRVLLAPELKERMVGGVVLPAELNQEVEEAWEVSAQLHVSADGFVQHVFMEQPLEAPQLNAEILKLLYGLQFNPGTPLDGIVEIYSPESARPVPEDEP